MNRRTFTLPDGFQAPIEASLHSLGYSLNEPGRLAKAVLRLSDHYTQNGEAETPWNEPWAQAASIAYYFPLNYARNRAVALEAQRLGFFRDLDTLIDFGSGTGS